MVERIRGLLEVRVDQEHLPPCPASNYQPRVRYVASLPDADGDFDHCDLAHVRGYGWTRQDAVDALRREVALRDGRRG